MKKQSLLPILIGLLTALLVLALVSQSVATANNIQTVYPQPDVLKRAVFEILDSKCNVCHRNQNPFMIFNEKNMTRRARKIYKMVFMERRMPKGNEIRLTNEERAKLEKWLFTQNIH